MKNRAACRTTSLTAAGDRHRQHLVITPCTSHFRTIICEHVRNGVFRRAVFLWSR
jgi:hypothetical protein